MGANVREKGPEGNNDGNKGELRGNNGAESGRLKQGSPNSLVSQGYRDHRTKTHV